MNLVDRLTLFWLKNTLCVNIFNRFQNYFHLRNSLWSCAMDGTRVNWNQFFNLNLKNKFTLKIFVLNQLYFEINVLKKLIWNRPMTNQCIFSWSIDTSQTYNYLGEQPWSSGKAEVSCPRGPRFKSWHHQRDHFSCTIHLDQSMDKKSVQNSNLALLHVL